MTKAMIAAGGCAIVLVVLAAAAGYRAFNHDARPAAVTSPAIPPASEISTTDTHPAAEVHPGFLYGRIATVGGAIHEGRLRWGDGEEAFWGDYFNGSKHENPWLVQVPPGARPTERHPIAIFGMKIAERESPIDVGRTLMARFGDISRIEARGALVRVTLKSGTVIDLDRSEASDFDDGVRVWDETRGVIDLHSVLIRSIELLPTPTTGDAPHRLNGTVRTGRGDFTGFVQWDRAGCIDTDEFVGRTAGGELSLRFDSIRSIARRSDDSILVTLFDGGESVFSGTREAGHGNRGIAVEDRRYGRVLIAWDAFERVDFSPGGSGPAYRDFPPGHPLTGSVTTRTGRRLAGRLVYDLDESETTETLDASSRGVNFTIPFGLIASIVVPDGEERGARHADVTLQDGEVLRLECDGDLGKRNAGMLIFVDGGLRPEYVPWSDVARIDLDRPPAMYPPSGGVGA